MSRTPLTTCPRCTHLCVGPSILPCSHLLCRKCLLLLLDTEPDTDVHCPTCHHTVLPAHTPGPRQVKQFPIDVVMERLVMKKLAEQAGGRRSVPHPSPSSPPSHICLECGDVFCDACTHVHRNISVCKHHTLMFLEPLESTDFPSKCQDDDAGGCRDNQDNVLQHTVNREVELFRQAMSTCDLVIDDLRDLLTDRQEDRHLLETYTHHLLTDDVSLSDILLRRFRHVREECTSVAETDMENLRQMRSRKIPEEKPDTQDISHSDGQWSWRKRKSDPQASGTWQRESRKAYRDSGGTWWHKLLPQLTWTSDNMTVWVALSVLVTLLLGLLMVSLFPSPVVPYTADRVVLQPLKAPASSLTGAPCGDHGCSSHYDGGVSDVLVTADRRVVLALVANQSIVVQSSSGEQTVKLGCPPVSLTQLPSGLLAVTCVDIHAVLLVNLDSSDHQIQRIHTGKEYLLVTAHPTDNTLIVKTPTESSVDVITLQGEVIRTLVDTRHVDLKHISSLTAADGYLLMTNPDSKQIHRIHLSDPSTTPVETLAGDYPFTPMDTAVDKAGNVFIVLLSGDVVMRSREGHYRQLLKARGEEKTTLLWRIALHDDRLVVVDGVNINTLRSDVTEYQLVDQ